MNASNTFVSREARRAQGGHKGGHRLPAGIAVWDSSGMRIAGGEEEGENLWTGFTGLEGGVRQSVDEQIEAIMNNARTPQSACDQLIREANKHGGEDNISVIVIWIE